MSWFTPKVNFQALLARYDLPNDGTPPPAFPLACDAYKDETKDQKPAKEPSFINLQKSLTPADTYQYPHSHQDNTDRQESVKQNNLATGGGKPALAHSPASVHQQGDANHQEPAEQTNLADLQKSLISADSYHHASLPDRSKQNNLSTLHRQQPPGLVDAATWYNLPSQSLSIPKNHGRPAQFIFSATSVPTPTNLHHTLPLGPLLPIDRTRATQSTISAPFVPYTTQTKPQVPFAPSNHVRAAQSVISAPFVPYTSQSNSQINHRPQKIFDPNLYNNRFVGMSITYNQLLGISTLLPSDLTTDTEESFYNTLIIDIACNKIGSSNSYGVFYGPSSANNCFGLLPPTIWQSSRNAGAYAVIVAVKTLLSMLAQSVDATPPLSRYEKEVTMFQQELRFVVFKTDLKDLKDAFSRNISHWTGNELQVANWNRNFVGLGQLMLELRGLVLGLEEKGVQVQIWQVDQSMNRPAASLAQRGHSGKNSGWNRV